MYCVSDWFGTVYDDNVYDVEKPTKTITKGPESLCILKLNGNNCISVRSVAPKLGHVIDD